jgi:hypothetical protein
VTIRTAHAEDKARRAYQSLAFFWMSFRVTVPAAHGL